MAATTCPNCSGENPSEGRFCVFCGSPLSGVAPQQGGPPQAPSLEGELRELRRALANLADRVVALERLQGVPAPQALPQEPVAPAPSAPAVLSGAPPEAEAGSPGLITPSPRFSIDWEQVLGKNWFAIIGAVALTLGVGFFLRLAFENNWIGVTGRIVLGIVVGMFLLGAGEYTSRRYPAWAQAVTGGGIAILYLSIYAAFGFYRLIDPFPAFLFLALVVALSGLLALRYESLVIALLGIFGAFLNPLMLGRDLHNTRLLLAYILVVDLGILGVSTFRSWRWFTLLGIVGSYFLFGLWRNQIPAGELVVAQAGLTGIFLVFVGATTLFHILWRRVPGPPDFALMTLNATAYYYFTYDLLWKPYRDWFGLITLAISLFYGLVGYGAVKRRGTPPQVALFSLATALVFLTIAVPIQLSGSWITVAWAAEGAVLVWVGFLLASWQTRAFGLGVFGIAALRLLVYDWPVKLQDFRPFLNERFPTFVVAIAAFYVGAYLYGRYMNRIQEWEKHVSLILAVAANLFTLWILSAEVIAYFDSMVPPVARLLRGQALLDAQNGTLLSLTALWALYALGVLAVALRRRSRVLRWGGLALLSALVLKLLLIDTFAVTLNPQTFRLVLNFHFLASIWVLAVMVFAVYLYWHQREELTRGERYVLPTLLVIANFVALWVLSAEALRFFGSWEEVWRTNLRSAKHLTLTVLWAVYGISVIGVGIVRGSREVRWAGIALLAVPVVKLFVFDVFLLERGYRVAAFITLGVLLLATGLAYQRYNKAVRGFLFGK